MAEIDPSLIVGAKERLFAEARANKDETRAQLFQAVGELSRIDKALTNNNHAICDGTRATRIHMLLKYIARYDFARRGGHLSPDFKVFKVRGVVKHFIDASTYGDKISDMAKQLLERWEAGDFAPAPIVFEESQLISDSESEHISDEELKASPPAEVLSKSSMPSLNEEADRLMRGLVDGTTFGGGHSLSIKRHDLKRNCGVFGHNGLKIGDWWPYQICLVRDGCHGRSQGGIAGTVESGAYSVILSGKLYHGQNTDYGDEILYSGSHGSSKDENEHGIREPQGTKALITSLNSRSPVRVIRGKGSSTWAPAVGLRYDGLYDVVAKKVQNDTAGQKYWQFRLVRRPGQDPIRRDIPNKRQIAIMAIIQRRRQQQR